MEMEWKWKWNGNGLVTRSAVVARALLALSKLQYHLNSATVLYRQANKIYCFASAPETCHLNCHYCLPSNDARTHLMAVAP